MALTDFFRINMPYGMKKASNDEWFVFNREYMPLGWNTTKEPKGISSDGTFSGIPINTKYKGLTDLAIKKFITDPDAIHLKEGEIGTFFLYNDGTNPMADPKKWNDYFDKIKALSKFRRVDSEY